MKRCEIYDGTECPRGHGTKKYVSSGKCVTCVSISSRLRYEQKKAKKNVEKIDIGRSEKQGL